MKKLINFIGYLPVALIMIFLLPDFGPRENYVAGWGLWFEGLVLFSSIFFLGYFSKDIGRWFLK